MPSNQPLRPSRPIRETSDYITRRGANPTTGLITPMTFEVPWTPAFGVIARGARTSIQQSMVDAEDWVSVPRPGVTQSTLVEDYFSARRVLDPRPMTPKTESVPRNLRSPTRLGLRTHGAAAEEGTVDATADHWADLRRVAALRAAKDEASLAWLDIGHPQRLVEYNVMDTTRPGDVQVNRQMPLQHHGRTLSAPLAISDSSLACPDLFDLRRLPSIRILPPKLARLPKEKRHSCDRRSCSSSGRERKCKEGLSTAHRNRPKLGTLEPKYMDAKRVKDKRWLFEDLSAILWALIAIFVATVRLVHWLGSTLAIVYFTPTSTHAHRARTMQDTKRTDGQSVTKLHSPGSGHQAQALQAHRLLVQIRRGILASVLFMALIQLYRFWTSAKPRWEGHKLLPLSLIILLCFIFISSRAERQKAA